MVDIAERSQEDIDKGLIRIGTETKTKPYDVTGRMDDLEFVDAWRQTGDPPEFISEDHKWLWDNGVETKYGLNVWPKHTNTWYVCLGGKYVGNMMLKEDGLWVGTYEYFESFHYQKRSKDKELVLKALLQVHSEGHEYRVFGGTIWK